MKLKGKKTSYLLGGVLIVVILAIAVYNFVPKGTLPFSAAYNAKAQICDFPYELYQYYGSQTNSQMGNKFGMYALMGYSNQLAQATNSRGQWIVTDFGNIEEQIYYVGLTTTNTKSVIGDYGLFMFPELKIYYVAGLKETPNTGAKCSQLVSDELNHGLKVADSKYKIYKMNFRDTPYFTCAANDAFLLSFKNLADARAYKMRNKVCYPKGYDIPKVQPAPEPQEGEPLPEVKVYNENGQVVY